jgi:hypothetical protein
MNKPHEILNISDTLRVAAYYDYMPDGPFDWGTLFVQTLEHDRFISELSTDDGHREPIHEILHQNPFTSFDGYSRDRLTKRDNWREAAITKHLTRAGFDCHFMELRGYMQGEWHDIVAYAEAGDITDWAGYEREIEAWYRGEVYWLALERLETYRNENGNTITQWETGDTIGGIYLLDGLTRELASEFFNIDAATVAA